MPSHTQGRILYHWWLNLTINDDFTLTISWIRIDFAQVVHEQRVFKIVVPLQKFYNMQGSFFDKFPICKLPNRNSLKIPVVDGVVLNWLLWETTFNSYEKQLSTTLRLWHEQFILLAIPIYYNSIVNADMVQNFIQMYAT